MTVKRRPPTRRQFLEASAAVAAIAVVGCEDDSTPELTADAAPDAALRRDAAGPDDAAPDSAQPDPDAARPDPDAAQPDPDAAQPDPDAVEPDPDAAQPDPDATAPDPDAAQQPPRVRDSDAFPQGLGSGDVTPDSALLGALYTGDRALEVVVWASADAAIVHDRSLVEPGDGGFVRYEVGGLEAGAWYEFAFYELEDGRAVAQSDVARFRAAIADDALEVIAFGAVSCTDNGGRFRTLLHAGDRDDLDFFLLCGDTTYNDGAETRAEYRAKWAENLETPAYRRLRRSTSVVATWDDHEVDNNWNPETIDADQLEAARAAFFEHLPVRRDPMAPERIWRSVRWGRTAEVFVLDCRGERRPSTRLGPDATYISQAQMDWLQAGLRASQATFKIVVNSVPMGDYATFGVDGDRWSGYPAQRDALLLFLDVERIPGLFVVSGDFHLASIGRLTESGPGSRVPEVLVGPGEQFPNPLALLIAAQPNVDWSQAINNYATFTLDPLAGEVTVTFHAADGRVLVERVLTP